MPNTKGTDVIALRKILQERGPEFERGFQQSLNPELRELYINIMATSWTPVEKQTALYAAAAQALYPGDPEPLRQLGRAMAQRSFTGIYKIFLRLPTIQFIMSRTAEVWRTYYDAGEAAVENMANHQGEFVVRKFPELPRQMREVICGHLSVILELTGAKQSAVTLVDKDPNAWRWQIAWQ
jgi:uncharacterized protein (TIGR02265 family)